MKKKGLNKGDKIFLKIDKFLSKNKMLFYVSFATMIGLGGQHLNPFEPVQLIGLKLIYTGIILMIGYKFLLSLFSIAYVHIK